MALFFIKIIFDHLILSEWNNSDLRAQIHKPPFYHELFSGFIEFKMEIESILAFQSSLDKKNEGCVQNFCLLSECTKFEVEKIQIEKLLLIKLFHSFRRMGQWFFLVNWIKKGVEILVVNVKVWVFTPHPLDTYGRKWFVHIMSLCINWYCSRLGGYLWGGLGPDFHRMMDDLLFIYLF